NANANVKWNKTTHSYALYQYMHKNVLHFFKCCQQNLVQTHAMFEKRYLVVKRYFNEEFKELLSGHSHTSMAPPSLPTSTQSASASASASTSMSSTSHPSPAMANAIFTSSTSFNPHHPHMQATIKKEIKIEPMSNKEELKSEKKVIIDSGNVPIDNEEKKEKKLKRIDKEPDGESAMEQKEPTRPSLPQQQQQHHPHSSPHQHQRQHETEAIHKSKDPVSDHERAIAQVNKTMVTPVGKRTTMELDKQQCDKHEGNEQESMRCNWTDKRYYEEWRGKTHKAKDILNELSDWNAGSSSSSSSSDNNEGLASSVPHHHSNYWNSDVRRALALRLKEIATPLLEYYEESKSRMDSVMLSSDSTSLSKHAKRTPLPSKDTKHTKELSFVESGLRALFNDWFAYALRRCKSTSNAKTNESATLPFSSSASEDITTDTFEPTFWSMLGESGQLAVDILGGDYFDSLITGKLQSPLWLTLFHWCKEQCQRESEQSRIVILWLCVMCIYNPDVIWLLLLFDAQEPEAFCYQKSHSQFSKFDSRQGIMCQRAHLHGLSYGRRDFQTIACDSCEKEFSGASWFCKQGCDYDVCHSCFVSLLEKQQMYRSVLLTIVKHQLHLLKCAQLIHCNPKHVLCRGSHNDVVNQEKESNGHSQPFDKSQFIHSHIMVYLFI
ncbi:hypothetical protein RFI_17410, partial [Reticulomyxa filosa]